MATTANVYTSISCTTPLISSRSGDVTDFDVNNTQKNITLVKVLKKLKNILVSTLGGSSTILLRSHG